MIALMWHLSATIRRYLRAYMPSNILLDRLRARGGRKWAMPVGSLLAPAYLFLASLMTEVLHHGGPGWLNLLVLLFIWNAMKFLAVAALVPILWLMTRRRPLPSAASATPE